MGKQNIRYYEDLYLICLRDYLKAKTKEDKLKVLKLIEYFKNQGNIEFEKIKASKATDEEYHKYRNMNNYKKVASKIPAIDKDKYNDDIARAEIKRIKKERAKRITRKTLYVVAAGALVAIIGSGVSCSKKKSNSTSSTSESTTETTIETTSETTTYGTDPTTTTTAGTPTFSSKDNNGITIIDPTTSQTNGDEIYGGSYGGSNNGSYNNDNYGSSNGGSSSSSSETEGTTKPTEGTTTTTSTTTVETTTDPSVPTTEPVVTVNTEPADERNQRDVVVDVHDGKNPEYIEEDDNESYETFIDVPTTTTTATTTSGTVNGMPIEEDENEEYETFFYIENMQKSNAKTLTLRK